MYCGSKVKGKKCHGPDCGKHLTSLGPDGAAVRCTEGNKYYGGSLFCSDACHEAWHAAESAMKKAFREKAAGAVYVCRHHKRYSDRCRCEHCFDEGYFDEGERPLKTLSLPVEKVPDEYIRLEKSRNNISQSEGVNCPLCGNCMRKVRYENDPVQ